jgi:hypothetical protein
VDVAPGPTCRACGADLATGQGGYVPPAIRGESDRERRVRKLRWRLVGAGEMLAGGAFAVMCTWAYFFPPGSVSTVGAIFSLIAFGHGLLTLITGSFISYGGEESEDDRQS